MLALILLATAGCDRGSAMEIRARASLTEQEGIAGLEFSLDGRTYDARDFRSDGFVPEIRTDVPSSGELDGEVELRQDGEVVASGAVSIEMRRGFEWGVDVFRQTDDPRLGCFGCLGAARFPIDDSKAGEPGEALWFVWGGRERGSDVVF